MKPATSSSFLYLGIPAAVVLLFALVATRLPRPSRPAPVPYLTIGGGACSGGTRPPGPPPRSPAGPCQSPGVSSCGSGCTDCTLSNPPNSTPGCSSGGSCTFTCTSGSHLCSSSCVSNTSTASCGTSGTAYPVASLGPGTATR